MRLTAAPASSSARTHASVFSPSPAAHAAISGLLPWFVRLTRPLGSAPCSCSRQLTWVRGEGTRDLSDPGLRILPLTLRRVWTVTTGYVYLLYGGQVHRSVPSIAEASSFSAHPLTLTLSLPLTLTQSVTLTQP